MSEKTPLCVPLPTREQTSADWVDATTLSAMQTHLVVAPCRGRDGICKVQHTRSQFGVGRTPKEEWKRVPRSHCRLVSLGARNDSADKSTL